jgi:hypothetical protein
MPATDDLLADLSLIVTFFPPRYRHLHVRHRAHEVAGLGTAMTAHCTQVLDGRLG